MLLAGCISVGAIESYWVLNTDADSTVALGALERSAVAFGGKQQSEAGPTGAAFAFNQEMLSFRVVNGSIRAYGASVATRGRANGQQSLNNLIERIVASASRDLHVSMQLVTGPLRQEGPPAVKQAGAQITATSGRFKEYGQYLQRVAAAVQKEWDAVLATTDIYPPPGTWVSITFVLAPDGQVARIKNVDSHTTPNGENLALTGLTGHAPFDPWTPEMKATLNPAGEELVFTFYYE